MIFNILLQNQGADQPAAQLPSMSASTAIFSNYIGVAQLRTACNIKLSR
jgi:hypothetical protein